MSSLIRWRDESRLLPFLFAACFTMLLAIVAAMVWSPVSWRSNNGHISTFNLLKSAYDRVEPGKTTQTELTLLGFDATRLKVYNLSSLGVREYFMPQTSVEFDQLDPAVRACFDALDRCSAMVIPLAAPRPSGFMVANAAARRQGHIVFLLRSGRVAYKTVDG
jgi:hypothetical protein